MRRLVFWVVGASLIAATGCIVKQECSDDSECSGGRICVDEACRDGCRLSRDCPDGQRCDETNNCVAADGDADSDVDCTVECPDDMVPVCGFCIDVHEASRPDATEDSAGADESEAVSREGVRPWSNMTLEQAEAACDAAGKRLCTAEEWIQACRGPGDTDYPYGNTYEPETCNGIDTYGRGNQRLHATGDFPSCTNGYGVFDISGNVWEIGVDGLGWVHGGAYNCIDSQNLHLCSYHQNFSDTQRTNVGFRCCSDGQ